MIEGARITALEAENVRLRRRLIEAGPEPDASPPSWPAAPEAVAVLHRARNTLAMVRAIIRRSADTKRSAGDCVRRLDGRLGAIARVQSAGLSDPASGIDLHSILADELFAPLARGGERVDLSGPKVLLAPRAAEVFALAVHEPASKAVEHGAPTRAGGHIAVAWRLEPGQAAPILALAWTETGMSALPATAPRRGFGTEMIQRTLRYELGAETAITYAPEGLRGTVRFPLLPRIGAVAEGTPRGDSAFG